MSAEAPVSPSNAQNLRPKPTKISGVPCPSMSSQNGGEAAISSLSVPAPRCRSRVHSVTGVLSEMSVQPSMPFRLKLKDSSEYHVTQHKRSSIPSSSVSNASGWASAYPFCARKLNTSVVDVNSIPMKRAPLPEVRPLASVGTVRIISGAASWSSCTMTGPGSRSRGASLSLSVPWTATRSQSRDPESPSIFQIHMFPESPSMVVRTTDVVVLSSWAQTGSEGWVPRSKATLQSSSVGGEVVRLYALTLTSGLLSGSSTTATTSSGVPSSSRSAKSGCVTA